MKLLKYVMTNDSGLAPNPYFDVCSLALCTPNHMNANLAPGDWIVGHSSRATGRRLIYAMRLTKVLPMEEYFRDYPDKRPNPHGTLPQQYGDNMYYREDSCWRRLPSAEHNSVESFQQDQGRRVYLAEGANSFWYFGAANPMTELQGFADRFPPLIQDRQGFQYVRDTKPIEAFTGWLSSLPQSGLLGKPRDQQPISANRYLTAIDPMHVWQEAESDAAAVQSTTQRCTRSHGRKQHPKRGC